MQLVLALPAIPAIRAIPVTRVTPVIPAIRAIPVTHVVPVNPIHATHAIFANLAIPVNHVAPAIHVIRIPVIPAVNKDTSVPEGDILAWLMGR